jgi:hypothetical protein
MQITNYPSEDVFLEGQSDSVPCALADSPITYSIIELSSEERIKLTPIEIVQFRVEFNPNRANGSFSGR